MFEIIFKAFFLAFILPFTIAKEAYFKLKKFLNKRNVKLDWLYVLFVFLIILLLILLLSGYR